MSKDKILVLSDLQDFSQTVAEKSIKIAKTYGKKLEVLHVEDESFLKFFKAKTEDSLIKSKELLKNMYKDEADVFSKCGKFIETVKEHIEQNNISTVIVGFRRERTFVEDLFNGSNLGSIVRKLDVPVIVIKTEDNPDYKDILIPTDLSKSSKKNIENLVKLFPKANFYVEHYFRTLIEDKIKMYGYENKEVQEYISFFANEAKDNLDKFMSELNIPTDIKVFKKVKNFLDITRTVEESIDSESIDLVSLCISTNFSIFSFDLLESSKKDVIIYKILEKFE